MSDNLIQVFEQCKNVLFGVDGMGNKIHPSMFDPSIVSLAHGDGTRRVHHGVLASGVLSLLDPQKSPDNYHVIRKSEELEHLIQKDFESDGIGDYCSKNIVLASGSTNLFDSIFTYSIGRNRKFLVPTSYYHNLNVWAKLYHANLECFYTQKNNNYKLTADELNDGIKKNDINSLILFNPSQTGAVYSDEELEQMAQVCIKENILVIVDSVFSGTELNSSFRTPQLAKYFHDRPDHVITIKSASKSHNLPNVRVGWACGGEKLISEINKITTAKNPSLPNVSLDMVTYALKNCDEYVRQNNVESGFRVELISQLCTQMNEKFGEHVIDVTHKPVSGHGYLLDFDYLISNNSFGIKRGYDLCRHLMKNDGIALSPADSLGFKGCKARIAFASVGLEKSYINESLEYRTVLKSLVDKKVPSNNVLISENTKHDCFHEGREILSSAISDNLYFGLNKILGR